MGYTRCRRLKKAISLVYSMRIPHLVAYILGVQSLLQGSVLSFASCDGRSPLVGNMFFVSSKLFYSGGRVFGEAGVLV